MTGVLASASARCATPRDPDNEANRVYLAEIFFRRTHHPAPAGPTTPRRTSR